MLLDIACGSGRNGALAARAGWRAYGVDHDREALRRARARGLPGVIADLESDGLKIPFQTGSCAAILVFYFLYRPLRSELLRLLAPGGFLIFETFTTRQRALGHAPRRDAFLLQPGELRTLFPELTLLRYEEGVFSQPEPQATARLLARKSQGLAPAF